MNAPSKKLVLIVIDALSSHVLRPAIERGRLPTFRQLVELGQVDWNCISIFPSITPAATSSIATGCYPWEHGISGAHFYDREQDRVHYYGADFWVILAEGMGQFFHDFLVEMNHHRLQAETIYQRVERAGLRSGCLNFLIFRGEVPHRVHVPLLLKLLPGVPFDEEVRGPQMLSLGDFVTVHPEEVEQRIKTRGGLFHRYGFDDDNTAGLLLQLVQQSALPDLTVAYYPDNDFRSHEVGPEDAEPTLEKFDRHLAEVAAVYGGVQPMLEQLTLVILGDHGQSDTQPLDRGAAIELDALLDAYNLVAAGDEWQSDEELMVCPNLRVAQIYLRSDYWKRRQEIIERLLEDARVDQVIWQEDSFQEDRLLYRVATADRGRLKFWPGDEGPTSARDVYGMPWSWEGDLRTLDAQVSPQDTITFDEYPNAFERIATSFEQRVSGDLWVTARTGYEFSMSRTSVNSDGGSHATLSKQDSTTALLVAGAPGGFQLPRFSRTVDVLPVCLELLGLSASRPAGASHVEWRLSK